MTNKKVTDLSEVRWEKDAEIRSAYYDKIMALVRGLLEQSGVPEFEILVEKENWENLDVDAGMTFVTALQAMGKELLREKHKD